MRILLRSFIQILNVPGQECLGFLRVLNNLTMMSKNLDLRGSLQRSLQDLLFKNVCKVFQSSSKDP